VGPRGPVYALAVVSTVSSVSTAEDLLSSPAAKAREYFGDLGETCVAAFLAERRPPRLEAGLRDLILANLPPEGEVVPTAAERAKIAGLTPVLAFHHRHDLTVKVIEVGHAFVGLHARTVLLLSRDALRVVTREELRAIAAHELGHEYVWDRYWEAMKAQAHARMQELELVCDGIAVATLRALGLPPQDLATAVTKVERFNVRRGAVATARSYVPLAERQRFIEELAGRPWSNRPRGVPRGRADECDGEARSRE
jgi:hypothetical protein